MVVLVDGGQPKRKEEDYAEHRSIHADLFNCKDRMCCAHTEFWTGRFAGCLAVVGVADEKFHLEICSRDWREGWVGTRLE